MNPNCRPSCRSCPCATRSFPDDRAAARGEPAGVGREHQSRAGGRADAAAGDAEDRSGGPRPRRPAAGRHDRASSGRWSRAPSGSTCSSRGSRGSRVDELPARRQHAAGASRRHPGARPSASIEMDAYVRRIQEQIDKAVSLATGLSPDLRARAHEHRGPVAPVLRAGEPARHEGRGQTGAARAGPAHGQARRRGHERSRARLRCSS